MEKTNESKILLLAGKGKSSKILYNYLSSFFSNIHVIYEEKPDRWKFIKRRAKRLGWFTAIGQVVFQLTIPKLQSVFSKNRLMEIKEKNGLSYEEIPHSVVTNVNSVNSAKSIDRIKEFNPDIVILNGTRIVSKKVLRSVPVKFINTHLGITPMYRGVHGGYWALAQNDHKNCGTTIHLVDEGIDTGSILKQVVVTPQGNDNFSTYPLLQLSASLPLMKDTVKEIITSNYKPFSESSENSRLWYHPTIFQYIYHLISKGVK